MALYPTIATITYKDKYLNIKIPLRIKKICRKTYSCDVCKSVGKFSQILDYYNSNEEFINIGNFEYEPSLGRAVPRNFMSKSSIICPICFLKNKDRIQMDIKEENAVMVYTTLKHRHIDILNILNVTLVSRWKESRGRIFWVYEDLEEINRRILRSIEHTSNEKNPKYNIVFHTITEEQLEKDYQDYIKRKVVRAI